MATPKVIILTGASRGIGLAMAHFLLKGSNKVVLVARSAGPMEELKKQYPGQVEVVAGDLSDFSVPQKVVDLALESFNRIDGLIINHGILSAVTRIADANPVEWQKVFDTNFISCVAFAKAALPSLRTSRGKIIMISSGAATGAYSTWGAYGSSKAAMNHLTLTLKVEEPAVTTIAIRPGVVDTGMQQAIREEHKGVMDTKDAQKFSELHSGGNLLKPEQPGNVCCRLVLGAPMEMSGKFYSWNDSELASFQDL